MTAQTKGLLAAVGAYLCWGFMPLYWALFGGVRGWEVIGHRVLWSLILISAFLMLIGRFSEIFSTLRTFKKQPIQYFNLFAAAAIAAINWWINVYAATSNQVVELGIGMFLTPLFTVALGVVFFRERLSRLKQLSVFLPFLGVCIMIYTLGRMPWIALGVSSSWALYGVFKKRLGIDPWVSNALEASLMLPFAIAYLFYLDANGVGACRRNLHHDSFHQRGACDVRADDCFLGCGQCSSADDPWIHPVHESDPYANCRIGFLP